MGEGADQVRFLCQLGWQGHGMDGLNEGAQAGQLGGGVVGQQHGDAKRRVSAVVAEAVAQRLDGVPDRMALHVIDQQGLPVLVTRQSGLLCRRRVARLLSTR